MICALSPMILFGITELLMPKKQLTPVLTVPPNVTPAVTWDSAPSTQSWSTLESVLMMVSRPILALEPTTAPAQITAPLSISASLATKAFGAMQGGKLR